MPRFFIDSDDGDLPVVDDEGYDLPDAHEARRMAIDVLPDLAREKIPNGDQRDFKVRVRDETGAVIYSACLALKGEWHVPRAFLRSSSRCS